MSCVGCNWMDSVDEDGWYWVDDQGNVEPRFCVPDELDIPSHWKFLGPMIVPVPPE